jgi:hypothetical protein
VLFWASLGEGQQHHGSWFGFGLLSDLGLPFDSLQMFLAAKAIGVLQGSDEPPVVLLADEHALSAGASAASVRARARERRREIAAISRVLETRFETVLASEIAAKPGYVCILAEARDWLARNPCDETRTFAEYSIRGVADDLYFARSGRAKVGWSSEPTIRAGHGGHHEPETDAIALRMERSFAARYVRVGTTLDSKRPKAVPYTQREATDHRLMLTGSDAGGFARKFVASGASERRLEAMEAHLAITVAAFEALVKPLAGQLVHKAEAIRVEVGRELRGTASYTQIDAFVPVGGAQR